MNHNTNVYAYRCFQCVEFNRCPLAKGRGPPVLLCPGCKHDHMAVKKGERKWFLDCAGCNGVYVSWHIPYDIRRLTMKI
jgi:hypothetical protein